MPTTKLPKLTTLYSTTIDDYYQGNRLYNGCRFYQEIKASGPHKELKPGFWFVNLNNYHWQLLFNSPGVVNYADPFGTQPPDSILNLMVKTKKKIAISSKDVQGLFQTSCGWFCIYICDQLLRGRTLPDVMNDFTDNTDSNELLLQKYFHRRFKEEPLDLTGIEGEGVVDFILNREPVSVKLFMYVHGKEPIHSIQIVRVPVNGMIQRLANWISKGELEKYKTELNYDDFFHLYLVINDQYRLERNETVTIFKDSSFRSVSPSNKMRVEISRLRARTLKELLNNAAERYGKTFWRYNIKTLNCQVFCKQVLTSNNVWTSQAENFTIQDTGKLISSDLAKKLTVITDLGGLVGKLSHYIPWVGWAANLNMFKKALE